MADTPRTQLERAFRLIQEERLDEALGILRPILDSDPKNADAWWLYANAVSEPGEARQALETVLRLNPKNTEARELLDQLNDASPADDLGFGSLNLSDPFAGLKPEDDSISTEELAGGMDLGDPFANRKANGSLLDEDAVPSFVGEGRSKPPRDFTVSDDEDLLTALGAASKPGAAQPSTRTTASSNSPSLTAQRPRNRIIFLAMGILVVLFVILGGLLLARRLAVAPSSTTTVTALAVVPTVQGVVTAAATFPAASGTGSATAAPTTQATALAVPPTGNATPTAAASPAANETQAATAASASDEMATAQQQTLAQFTAAGLTKPNAVVNTSSLGQTLTVSFCSPFGPQLVTKVNQAMDMLAAQATTVSDQVQAISVEVYNCINTSQLEFKAVSPIQDVLAYVNKTMTARQFRAAWKSS